ncbi:tetratricopeptide repeat protein [Undibacterium fentianense]|uniref:Tetratricopeptide repeat protein n=1 Tax=Undibacterium fentianense TaxID=2828728 RepID=A0A941E854_9BURK|nr:hypothetical protein [Undibacterium fentianense]MBR7801493.1 hypothetical protein [Undibacterium fentianense]
MRLVWFLSLLCSLLALPCVAQAQKLAEPSDSLIQYLKTFPKAYDLFAGANYVEAQQALENELASHENEANYFNVLGVLQLKQQNYLGAAASFERAVLIDPSNAGSWMDLAIATLETGNLGSASSYFDYIEVTFKPSKDIQQVIDGYKRFIQKAKEPKKKLRYTAEFGVGRDSNANSGLQSAYIPITFGSDRVNLPLDPSYQARSDQYVAAALQARYDSPFDVPGLEMNASVKRRGYQRERDFSTTELSGNVGWQRPSPLGLVGVTAFTDVSWLGDKGLLRDFRLSGSIERSWRDCFYGASLENEWRRYMGLHSQDADLRWAQLAGACKMPIAGKALQATIVARYGNDLPTRQRAGGKTRRKEVVAQLGAVFRPQWRFDLSWNAAFALDSEGYSPLLENNARRQVTRRTARIQLTKTLNADLDLFFRVDDSSIASNILLFSQKAKSFNLGLQRRF